MQIRRPSPLIPTEERLVLVSNRLPIALSREGEGTTAETADGWGAVGLSRPQRESGGCWVGWPGLITEGEELPRDVERLLDDRGMRGIPLDAREHEHYYTRTCNRCIWPLFHSFTERVKWSADDWSMYEDVNRRFARAVLEEARDDDLVFVHDFHLMLVPRMLREERPELRVGFFLHTPFPSSDIFRIFPARDEVLRGLLGADVIAFHTLDYLRNFRGAVRRILGVEARTSELSWEGRLVHLLAEPRGIDPDAWRAPRTDPQIAREVERLEDAAAGRRVVLGVDRLDYTKGIRERLVAYRDLLTEDPALVERVVMIQVAVPPRVEVEESRTLKAEVDRLAGEINSTFGRPGLQPLHYLFRDVSRKALTAMYRKADVALVTPLREGLSLVAKEFVASRDDDTGVLVLGELSGAAWELGEALHVNPFDPASMCSTLRRALEMPADEQARRMRPMRERVGRSTVHAWTNRCLNAIRSAERAAPPELFEGTARERTANRWRYAYSHALFLDYDGTLRDAAANPEDAAPTEEILRLVGKLARQPSVDVWILSGRSTTVLDGWLGSTGAGLIAEHGAFVKRPADREFSLLLGDLSLDWRPEVYSIMEQLVDRVPGSRVEEKPIGLAWRYGESDPSLAVWQAHELYEHLGEMLAGQNLEVARGRTAIEVRPADVTRGRAATALLAERPSEPGFLFAAGDAPADESLFRALPEWALTILVGERESAARYRLPDPAALRGLLHEGVPLLGSAVRQGRQSPD